MSKNFERVDLQGPINEAVASKLKEIGCEPTDDHVRRTIRALLHVAGKMALEAGCQADGFRELADECYQKERTSQEPKYAKEVPTQVTFGNATMRTEARAMGGSVIFGQADVVSNVPIFSEVEEQGSKRIVRAGSDLDIAIRKKLGASCINGGSPIFVMSAKSAVEFRIEYTRGYK